MPPTDDNPTRILYVEDDSGLARLLERRLAREGFSVDLAFDGEEGLKRLRGGGYAAAIVDYRMPGMDGLEVLRKLQDGGNLLPTVMVTGAGDESVAVEAMKLGAGDYVVKDSASQYLELLPATLRRLLEKSRLVEEKLEAERQLRRLGYRNRLILETAGEGIFGIDVHGRITFANRVAAAITGWQADEMLGRDSHQLMHHTRRDGSRCPIAECRIQKAMQHRIPARVTDEIFWRKDGTWFPVEYVATPIEEENEIIGAVVVFSDITRRKLAEDDLKLSKARIDAAQRRLSDAIESISEGFVLWDADDRLVLCNGRYREFYSPIARHIVPGIRFEEMIRMALAEELVADALGHEETWLAGRLERHRGPAVPFDEHLNSGFWLRLSEHRTADGGTVGIHADITPLKKRERELAESEARKGAILEAAFDCIVTMDRDGRIVEFNPAAERAFGYTRDQALGRAVADLIVPPAQREGHLEGVKRYLDQGESKILDRRIEVEGMRADGTTLPVELAITPVRLENQMLFTAYLRDITDRRKAEEAIRMRLEMENVVSVVAAGFVSVEPEELEGRIEWSLRALGTFEGIDRSFVFLRQKDSNTFVCRHEWCGKGTAPTMEKGREIGREAMPWLFRRLERADVVQIADVERLPKTAAQEREVWQAAGIRSVLIVPMTEERRLAGFIGLNSLRTQKSWSDYDVSLLTLVGEIMSVALERRQAEERLRESEERYRQLFVGNRAVELLIDLGNGAIVDANAAAAEFYGYSVNRLKTFDIAEVDAPGGIPTAQELERAERLGGGRCFLSHRLASGETRDVEVHSGPVTVSGRSLTYAIVHDITERRKAERALRNSERRFRDIASAASDWFWEMDANLRFTYISDRFFAAMKLRPGQVLGRTRHEVAGEAQVAAHAEKWQAHFADLAAHRAFRDFSYAITGDDDIVRHITLSGIPVVDETGVFQGYRGTGTDVIGIGEGLSAPPLPHHRTYGSVYGGSAD